MLPRLIGLVMLLGLAAASAHAPAMALPAQDAVAVEGLHADCHGAAAVASDAAPASDDLSCCPDGCKGGCLLPAAPVAVRSVPQRVAVRSLLVAAAPWPLHGCAAAPGFHPPRLFA